VFQDVPTIDATHLGTIMKIYVYATLITLAATAIIINACLFHESTKRAVPINLYHP
jgi:hypothetical protein